MQEVQLTNSSMSSLANNNNSNNGNSNGDNKEEARTYKDKSIEVTDAGLLIHRYHFPTLKSRLIAWEDVEWVTIGEATQLNWLHVCDMGPWYYRNGVWVWWNLKCRSLNRRNGGAWRFRNIASIRRTTVIVKTRGSKLAAGAYVHRPDEAAPLIRRMVDRHSSASLAQ
ncbi:hypothetical protein H4217_005763 [Coemansia sp. RSA 1939]|nr:hypothetical protein H4217_005763 [Coemansia sp. RSA 1939]